MVYMMGRGGLMAIARERSQAGEMIATQCAFTKGERAEVDRSLKLGAE